MSDIRQVKPRAPNKKTSRRVDPVEEDPTIILGQARRGCVWNGEAFPSDSLICAEGVVYKCVSGIWEKQEEEC